MYQIYHIPFNYSTISYIILYSHFIHGVSVFIPRGLGYPQKQSPVLSVSEMYMETLLAFTLRYFLSISFASLYNCRTLLYDP